MTDSRKVQLEIGADTSGAREGFEQVKQGAKDMASAVGQACQAAGKGLEGIGEGGGKSAKQLENSTRSIIASIERTTATMKAGERGTADYFEELYRQRGGDVAVLKPYLEGLRQAEQAQKAASASLGTMGVSAAQTAAALRNVPAQFSDIITSLQGGQAPLTVLLQQGGQLKDMFGGVGEAASALGGYVFGLINPFTLAAAALGGLAYAYNQGANEGTAFSRQVILTGTVAGVSAGQLTDMAAAVASMGGATQGRAAEVLLAMASSAAIGIVNLARFTAAAVELERVGGPAAEETAKAFAELGKAPLEASIKLNESTNFLTASVVQQIKALEDQGRTVDAARVAQEAYFDAINGRAPAMLASLGTIERAWLGIKGAIKQVADDALSIGRDVGPEGQIKALQNKIAATLAGNFDKATLPALREQLALLEASAKAARDGAAAAGDRAKQVKAALEFDKDGEKFLDQKLLTEREVVRVRALGVAAGRTQEEIETRIAAIRAKAADKPKADKGGDRDLAEQTRLLAELSGVTGDYQQDLARLQVVRAAGNISEARYLELVTALIAKQPMAKALLTEQAAATAALAKAQNAAEAEHAKLIKGFDAGADAIARQVQALQDEEAALQISVAQNISLAQALHSVAIARLQDEQAKQMSFGDDAAVDALQREIDKRRELQSLMGRREARDDAARAAKDATEEWRKAADGINSTITDALMRGFESGKSFAKNLRDTIVNMFKTMVLRPIVSAVVQTTVGSVFGGAAGSALAGGAAGAGGSLLGGLAGAGAVGASLTSIGSAIGAGFMSTLGGSTIAGGGAAGALAGGAAAGTSVAGMIGAAIPYVAVAALIGNALGLFRSTKTVGSGITGTLGEGDINSYDLRRKGGSLFRGPSYSTQDTGVAAQSAAIQNAYGALRDQAAGFASALGMSADVVKSFTVRLGDSKEGLRLEGLSGEAAAEKVRLALVSANDALARSVLGSFADSLKKEGESAAQTLERLAGGLQGVNGIFAALGQTLLASTVGGADAASQVLDLFGGISKLQSASQSYFEAFYTEAERSALAAKGVSSALGELNLAMPQSREAYRALVESQDLTTDSGRKAYASLLQLAPAFAEVVAATAELGAAADTGASAMAAASAKMVEAGRKALADLASDKAGLSVDLLRAQGKGGDAAALQREQTIAALTSGLSAVDAAAAVAALDYNTAMREQIAVLESATAAAEAIASQRTGLEGQLLQAQGDTAALRQRELAALDPSNRALQERIFALQDEQATAQALAQTQAAAAQAAEAIASQRFGLEGQLLQAQGDTAALRQRELAALDPSNRALQERIFALQDEQSAKVLADQAIAAAAEKAAASLRALADVMANLGNTRFDLQNQLLGLQGQDGEVLRRTRERDLAELTQGLSAEDAARVTAAYDLNAALRQQIADTQAAQQAAQALAQAQAQAAADAQRAAEQIKSAWQSVTDSIFDEVARIRGLIGGASAASYATAQAQFAITSAQARAGDQDAARLLPGMSQALLTLAEAQASSQLDLQRIRALVAASLSATGMGLAGQYGLTIPRLATGTNYVPTDMLAVLHEGEAVQPKAYNPAAGGHTNRQDTTASEIRALREEQQAQARASVQLAVKLTRLIESWELNGMPETRVTT